MNMRIIVEIKGERHRLLKGLTKIENPCVKCSLKKECVRGKYSNDRVIWNICHVTYSGFRKMKKEQNEKSPETYGNCR